MTMVTRLARLRWHQLLNLVSARNRRCFASGSSMDAEVAAEGALSGTPFPRPMLDHEYELSPTRKVPSHIVRPPYAETGKVYSSFFPEKVLIHDAPSIRRMRAAARLARRILDLACAEAEVGRTTDEVDAIVHEAICDAGAYPSPLNYAGFPKSLCASVNEVICHGIPTPSRQLQLGDVVSFDVSCYLDGVHGDNCATIIVGDVDEDEADNSNKVQHSGEKDWRGVPVRTNLDGESQRIYFQEARRLVNATREGLYAGIDVCRPGNCLSDIGGAIQDVSDRCSLETVEKYRGHGIGTTFHCAPYVKHFRNNDRLPLQPGMIFTIEPMFTIGSASCFEWDDEWTVATVDNSLSAQFEHTILVTEGEPEILTLPD